MRVLVVGANGFIGSYITAELLKDNHDVVCAVRDIKATKRKFRLCPKNCVNSKNRSLNFVKPILKFNHQMSHSFIPVWNGHSPFFGQALSKKLCKFRNRLYIKV